MAKTVELIATAAFGLESVVAHELKRLGYDDQTVEDGRVTFRADMAAIARTNLWLRSAERVLVKVGSFRAMTFEELFQGVKALPWADWLPVNALFPVDGKSIRSQLFSVSDCQAITKKAIVEKMKQTYRQNWFDENGPKYQIEVGLLKDVVTLTIDTSGPGLHKRGYRQLNGPAALKETMAAALLSVARWYPDRPLIDPFCGSGTIPIEAALIGMNVAPGSFREFAAEKWHQVPAELWRRAREEARDLVRRDEPLRIVGTDISEDVLSYARHHSRVAGVADKIHFQRMDVKAMRSRFDYGFVICNPPYGERLGEQEEAEAVYRSLKEACATLPTWSVFVLTSHPRFEFFFGRNADKKRKLYNGRIQCNYYQYFGPRRPRLERTAAAVPAAAEVTE
ncbi:THUMP domain-containing class I SAM-dependent RNA methyltransferase [Heliophilum fasciatum]|uniref:Putative N6-adenine-specific DNA methylase n=1 Tax=Heliophilum fasciatum TaxID=35700 RepID=A0A4R2RNB1_9FIRM|nr:class I SAM-dependent RNA methyltransferase [Heliophilum fasciatum]MCW2278099.1 putative N6-adenine-specific DNA methylase [Heliophilum fasciatum]TCP64169.1 putative N6-adenine-specific DNA methylase [Heliophilum fasciatum]